MARLEVRRSIEQVLTFPTMVRLEARRLRQAWGIAQVLGSDQVRTYATMASRG